MHMRLRVWNMQAIRAFFEEQTSFFKDGLDFVVDEISSGSPESCGLTWHVGESAYVSMLPSPSFDSSRPSSQYYASCFILLKTLRWCQNRVLCFISFGVQAEGKLECLRRALHLCGLFSVSRRYSGPSLTLALGLLSLRQDAFYC